MQVNHRVEGAKDGPAVVLHTSLGCALRMWDPQIRALTAAGFRVVRYDYRGHGSSLPAPGPYTLDDLGTDVLELMDSLGIAEAAHVGLSLGGMVAMWLAERTHARVTGLVLCATSAALAPASAWSERAAKVRAAGSTTEIADAFLPRWLGAEFSVAHPDTVKWVRDQILETSPEGFAGGCEAIAGMDLLSGLDRIDVPTAVVVGKQDPGTPPEHSELIAATIPGATLSLVDPGAHLVNVEQPEPVSGAILGLLTRIAP
ncbi:3-oxoadipate enol-lactonase [Amycolatopsis sp. A1MSW2902]|uniref:3-oxoadipate enol-lactonase n=1 Tax=Amycolatopsis sp. A1MSW2902 TaxID=687413 RepID=UPI00307F13EA